MQHYCKALICSLLYCRLAPVRPLYENSPKKEEEGAQEILVKSNGEGGGREGGKEGGKGGGKGEGREGGKRHFNMVTVSHKMV